MRQRAKVILTVVLSMVVSLSLTLGALASDFYENDPRENSEAMKDIVVDENAVFGFAPDPESSRLGEYASYDWSDPEFVKSAVKNRADYHNQNMGLYTLMNKLYAEGKSVEEVARAVSKRRNEIRIESYKNDPEGLAKLKKSNLKSYGNEEGPTADSLYEKYGSWEMVLQKAFSTNSGMDACLGMYDIFFDTYVRFGMVNSEASGKTVYKVKKNDNLSKIAAKYYGDNKMWVAIFNANKDQIKDPNVLYEGMKLVINLSDY